MDESLSEFQETKKSCTGPKNIAKKTSKPKKAPKRPRGQKDIRTALQTKKNELESYSKDFDKVCKKAGIDVDPEQLQLAIALSKSLQDKPSTSNDSAVVSQTVTTQERIGKIRTTLQEYGFKVPEVKIAGTTRKVRKHRKNYKLLQTSYIEKKEIIANRFSQVLFQNIPHYSLYYSDKDTSNIPLYNLASNVTYDVLRIKETFYVDNLIEKSISTGNLLRDWSKIPGRPKSPKLFVPMSVSFSEIECSQEELNIILSGSLKSCKEIARKKIKDCLDVRECKVVSIEDNIDNISVENNKKDSLIVNDDVEVVVETISTVNKYRSCSPDMFDDDVSDIFEDTKNVTIQRDKSAKFNKTNIIMEVLDLTEPVFGKSQPKIGINSSVTNRKSNDMELTACIEIQSNHFAIVDQTTLQLSQKTNVTKRRSNDLMELTECVATSSQPMQQNVDLTDSPDIIEEHYLKDETYKDKSINTKPTENKDIDLTSSPENNYYIENRNTQKDKDPEKYVESMDLTQCSNTSEELPFVSLTAAKEYSPDDTIILDINDYAHINKITNSQTEKVAHIDLTPNIQNDIESSQSFFEEYNHDHSNNLEDAIENNSESIANEELHERIDLTQHSDTKSSNSKNSSQESRGDLEEKNSNYLSKPKSGKDSCSQSIIEPIPVTFYPISSHIKNLTKANRMLSPNKKYDNNPIDDIDLTQKTDTSEESDQHSKNDSNNSKVEDNNMKLSDEDLTKDIGLPAVTISQRYSSLFKEDDVSIDYDNIINIDANNKLLYSENANSESIIYENPDENIEKFSKNNSYLSSSQNSEIFEISDKELDYSLHKSKLEMPKDNFAFGGLSIMDDMSNFRTSKISIEVENQSKVNEIEIESFPTIYNDKSNNINKCNVISPIKHRRITEIATPQKACSSDIVTVITPKNGEMIIKTNNVTPMKDYESMSMHDIHIELDKYGIKPFKRKRGKKIL